MAKKSKGKLQKNYSSFAEFESYSNLYNLAEKLGYDSAQAAWDANPTIQWSVNPNDFKRVSN